MRGGWVERGTVTIRLGRPHFAFFRGYLDGLDISSLAARYLPTATGHQEEATSVDLRLAKALVEWIRAQLMIAARRSLPPADARVLAIAPGKLDHRDLSGLPPLDVFQESHDPDNLYNQAELLELYEQQYGPSGTAHGRQMLRNKRMRRRQQRALQDLEVLVAADPRRDDGIDGWLDPVLCTRLHHVNVETLDDLIKLIDRYGFHWYRKVPKIGVKAASHVGRWLQETAVCNALSHSLPARAFVPPHALITRPAASEPLARAGIVAFESLRVPEHLNGRAGTNRGERPLLAADDDLTAILSWISVRGTAAHTARSYRKEAERFLLWCVIERGKAMSSLVVEDCAAYRDFLALLGRATPADWSLQFRLPQSHWIGPRGAARTSAYWRPFHGPLGEGSQQQALTIIQSLLQWLTEQDYLHGNPMKGLGMRRRAGARLEISHALSVAEWQTVRNHLVEQGTAGEGISEVSEQSRCRTRAILALGYGCGLRLAEIVGLRCQDMQAFVHGSDASPRWLLRVHGKGNIVREVALPSFAMDELRAYFRTRGHVHMSLARPNTPLIAALSQGQSKPGPLRSATVGTGEAECPLTVHRVYRIVKRLFERAAASVETFEPEQARRLRAASTHWLRHTFATHALSNGMPLEVLRDLLGHRSLDTTSLYVTTERDRRSDAMESFGARSSFSAD